MIIFSKYCFFHLFAFLFPSPLPAESQRASMAVLLKVCMFGPDELIECVRLALALLVRPRPRPAYDRGNLFI
jgi:hypothetical protein